MKRLVIFALIVSALAQSAECKPWYKDWKAWAVGG